MSCVQVMDRVLRINGRKTPGLTAAEASDLLAGACPGTVYLEVMSGKHCMWHSHSMAATPPAYTTLYAWLQPVSHPKLRPLGDPVVDPVHVMDTSDSGRVAMGFDDWCSSSSCVRYSSLGCHFFFTRNSVL